MKVLNYKYLNDQPTEAMNMSVESGKSRYASPPKGSAPKLKDGTQDGSVYGIPTNSEKYDMGRMKYDSVGSKGYPKQAFDYDY